MDKKKVHRAFMECLEKKLNILIDSAVEARDAATNEESKAENKYDTRGLEASYLAGAQANRAQKLKESITYLAKMKTDPQDKVELGALVKIQDENDKTKFIYLVPQQGGESFVVEENSILTVTPEAPIAKALIGKSAGDEVVITIKSEAKEIEIISVC